MHECDCLVCDALRYSPRDLNDAAAMEAFAKTLSPIVQAILLACAKIGDGIGDDQDFEIVRQAARRCRATSFRRLPVAPSTDVVQ